MQIDVNIPDYLLEILKTNKKISVEFSKEILIKKGYSLKYIDKLPVFIIDHKKYLVRLSKGSSSEKGIGRENIKDSKFINKFDYYLFPNFSKNCITFDTVEKYE